MAILPRLWLLVLLWCPIGSDTFLSKARMFGRTTSATFLNRRSIVCLSAEQELLLGNQNDKGGSIQSALWMFRGHPIAYEYKKSSSSTKETPVLLLNGFGMGSFHQHRLMNELSTTQDEPLTRDIYAMDFLGQGDSWPIDCDDGNSPSERGLRYCAETWMHQIIAFIESAVIENPKVHLVGNSVGGHLAVFVASTRPDLVESIVLLNATPFWGLNLPGWSGHLPAPLIPKLVGRYLFDRIREEATIRHFLETTYTNYDAFDSTLVRNVQRCTDNYGGHAAFASILWSPPLEVDGRGFYECLENIQSRVLLCFGSDDPWCKPAFGRRMLQVLEQRSHCQPRTQVYVELTSVGHCPNHEAPRATAKVISVWMNGKTNFQQETVMEEWGETLIRPKTAGEISVNPLDQLSTLLL